MVIAWVLYPLVLLAICVGCGLLVERVGSYRVPGPLLPSLGLALVIVVAVMMSNWEVTTRLAAPLVVVLAVSGYALSWRHLRTRRPDWWSTSVAAGLFAVFAAPVVLSGQATFLGYFFLNDAAWHFALIDQLLTHGHDYLRLPPGSFRGIVQAFLTTDYPVGAQLGAGVVPPLLSANIAWVFQPYLAVMMSLVGLTLYQVLDRAVRPPGLRAFVAFVAAQPGLVYAYYLSGNIKELGTLWILVLTVAMAIATLQLASGWRQLVPLAVITVAGLDVLNLAIGPWVGVPLAAFIIAFTWRRRRAPKRDWLIGLMVVAIGLVLAVPALKGAKTFVQVASGVLTTSGDLGNLVRPLEWWQLFGIWPVGDFRFPLQSHQQVAFALMGVTVASSVLGGLWLLRRRPPAVLLLLASSLIALFFLTRQGSPYANAKTMMIASPAIVLTAMLGSVALRESRRRVESWLLAAVIGSGVLWTNALGYHDANLAPRDRLSELESIDNRFAGRGPAYLSEWDEFAGHFLRRVNVSNMPVVEPQRRAGLPTRDYRHAQFPIGLDELVPEWVQRFRLIILRRTPLATLPPSNYRLVWTGRYYAVWERRAGSMHVVEHVQLGGAGRGGTGCGGLQRIALRAQRAHARLAYTQRPRLPTFIPTRGKRPPDWGLVDGDPYSLEPRQSAGSVRGSINIGRGGRYAVWVQGIFDRPLTVKVAGQKIGSVGHEIGASGSYVLAGTAKLPGGSQRIEVVRPGDSLAPGTGGTTRLLGPVVLAPLDHPPRALYIDPRSVRQLCNKRLDWVEIVR